jgi:hypothetical protein
MAVAIAWKAGRAHRAVVHHVVDVGAERQRLAPVAHGTARIGGLRGAEIGGGEEVVEAHEPGIALVERLLRRLAGRRHDEPARAEAVEPRQPLGLVRCRCGGERGQMHAGLEELVLGPAGVAADAGGDARRVEQLADVAGRRGRASVRGEAAAEPPAVECRGAEQADADRQSRQDGLRHRFPPPKVRDHRRA